MRWRFYPDKGRSKAMKLKDVKTILTDEQIAEAKESKISDPLEWVSYRVPSGFLVLEMEGEK